MLLTLTYTRAPAQDLGYLLAKNPARVHERRLAFGTAHVFYPEATDERTTAALLLEIDPVGLVRRGHGVPALEAYVNDRPYVASSFLSVAIADAFGSALSGRSRERAELAEESLPLSAHLPVVPSRGGEGLVRRLFEPLGYAVLTHPLALDPKFPEWGESRYLSLTIEGQVRLQDLLAHLYVLLPVLDDDKHYWVGEAEVEKLLRRGEGWLGAHPERQLIVDRYLVRQRPLTKAALVQLAEDDPDPDASEEMHDSEEAAVEAPLSLNEQRMGSVFAALKAADARSVVDLGCGEGRLLQRLLDDGDFKRILGVDVSHRALEIAARRLRLDRMPERKRARIELLQGSLVYRDSRLAGYDAAALVEVIEHLEPERLAALEANVFGTARPQTVVVTTPNVEYNATFETLPAGRFRHRDHRFEWTRDQFRGWAGAVAQRHDYSVRYVPIGPEDPEVGPPTQMAVFSQ